MKPPKRKTSRDTLTGEIRSARLRLAKAESQLNSAKAQARLAKRRRKEAKQAARRAKKQARLAKREFAEAKLALAEAEARLSRGARGKAASTARKRGAARAAIGQPRKQPTSLRGSASLKPSSRKRPTPRPQKPVSEPRTIAEAAKQPIVVPRDFDIPTASVAAPVSQATLPTGQALGAATIRQAKTEPPVAPAATEGADTTS